MVKNNINEAVTNTYSEHEQTYKMELSVKTANRLKPLTVFTKTNPSRSSHQRCSVKKVYLNVLQVSQGNTCVEVSF